MDASGTERRTRWQFGIHPAATGSVVRSISRVDLPAGDALRIEMADAGQPDPTPTDLLHIQYHVTTESGGWALWISAPAGELVEAEARLPELVSPAETDTPA